MRDAAQIERAASTLHSAPDVVFTSDLLRARESAAIFAAHFSVPLLVRPGLREICFGEWEGLSWHEIENRFPKDSASWLKRFPADVNWLTELVYKIEATEELISDWSLPGVQPEAAAYEMARTTCRRAERTVVRFIESGAQVDPNVLAYLNRLSDLIWLFGRRLEVEAGVDSRLRDAQHPGTRWSRAW